VTNCESLIIAHHKRQSSYKRFNLKQIEERIAKAKGKNKRKLDAQLMKPDETPIMDNELPRQVYKTLLKFSVNNKYLIIILD